MKARKAIASATLVLMLAANATSADTETISTETQGAPTATDLTPLSAASSDVAPGAALEPKCAAMEEGAECWKELTDKSGCYVWDVHYFAEQTVTWSGPCAGGVIVGRERWFGPRTASP